MALVEQAQQNKIDAQQSVEDQKEADRIFAELRDPCEKLLRIHGKPTKWFIIDRKKLTYTTESEVPVSVNLESMFSDPTDSRIGIEVETLNEHVIIKRNYANIFSGKLNFAHDDSDSIASISMLRRANLADARKYQDLVGLIEKKYPITPIT